jgi:hypothetical protein
VTIAVPVGHQIEISKSFRNNMRVRFEGFNNGNDWYWYRDDEKDYDYKYDVPYVMREDGLYTLDGISSERQNDWEDNSTDNYNPVPEDNNRSYRYDTTGRFDSLKNEQEKQIERMQAAVDSMKAAREKAVERTKDSLRKAKEEIDRKIEKLDNGTALHSGSLSSSQDGHSFIMNI